ncbi:urease accessory protein UreD [Methylobacterium marchantiae]|uniref:Urease accessory protein UreD n=1 Tax=Methylobacterium marchantiae TaxID=600331 RepID=A0ABW3WXC4_9HYPH|nr:Urease accessory protein UreD [Methylobacterium marchantiae]
MDAATTHSGLPIDAKPLPDEPGAGTARRSEARLSFVRGGGTTVLSRQVVPYPFHITRPFRLYPHRPDIATLYLQSASGGLYRDDRLVLDVRAGRGANAHVTTQSATVVHHTGAFPARQSTRLAVASDAFLTLHPDPMILFPGAALALDTRIVLEEGARAIVSEGFAHHDPLGQGRPFSGVELTMRIETADGRRLVTERSRLDGEGFAGSASPLGHHAAYGAMAILAAPEILPDLGDLQALADDRDCLCGISPLPNGAGLGARFLAGGGGALAAGMEAVFGGAFAALSGTPLARRRK